MCSLALLFIFEAHFHMFYFLERIIHFQLKSLLQGYLSAFALMGFHMERLVRFLGLVELDRQVGLEAIFQSLKNCQRLVVKTFREKVFIVSNLPPPLTCQACIR